MWGFPNAAPPAGGQGMPVNPWMFAQPGMLPHPSMYSQFAPQEGMPQGMPVPPAAERELEPSAGGKAKRRKKKEKKQGEPKKPATSFVMFSNAVRERIKTEHPGLSFTEVGRKLGEMWREMGPEEKKTYEDMALDAKEKYIEAKRIWLSEQGESGGQGGGDHPGQRMKGAKDMAQALQAIAPMMQGGVANLSGMGQMQGMHGMQGMQGMGMSGGMGGMPGMPPGMPGQHP